MDEKKKWYEYDDLERAKKIYSNFSIDSFWNWWSSNKNKVMEVRIKDYKLIKETAEKFDIPYSASGVYVCNSLQLKKVIKYVRDKATIWFGINPRKKNYNKYNFKSYGGSDVNVQSIDYIFIDIDRIKKVGWATSSDLKKCDVLANHILTRLETQGWNKSYIKICSGNGVQLLIKLDFPIVMPNIEYDLIKKEYVENDDYIYNKEVIRKSIGAQILKFGRKFKDELMVDIDKSGFNIGRVGALPVTKNIKFEGFRWRGIVELEDGVNDGLSDYAVSKWEDLKLYKEKSVFGKVRVDIGKNKIQPGKLMQHKLVKFILQPDLPVGECNNKVWFMLKCILRDSKFDMSSDEYKKFHRKLEKNWKTTVSNNLPDKQFSFNPNILNSFFINHLIPPIYDILPDRIANKHIFMNNQTTIEWQDDFSYIDGEYDLPDDTTIQEDLIKYSKLIKEGKHNHINNTEVFIKFLKGCITKYGEEKTKYFHKYLFERYFSYK